MTTGQSSLMSGDALRLVSRLRNGKMTEDHGLLTIGLKADSKEKTTVEELRNRLGQRETERGMIIRKVRGMIRRRKMKRIFVNMNYVNITSLGLV
jgi:hypothetical protein